MDILKTIPDGSVDLVLTDPPYNIGVVTKVCGRSTINAWDKIEDYTDWCIAWLQECQRVLKPTGVLYFWHNDIAQIAELICAIREKTTLRFHGMAIWNKGDTYRAQTWKNRKSDSKSALRSWFNVCEYCIHFFAAPNDGTWHHTGNERINSTKECYKPLKRWYETEKRRIGVTDSDIALKYVDATGKKPYMLRHYFRDSQFGIPTQAVWETVYIPLGFEKSYEDLRASYEELRASYGDLRASYEDLRNVHNVDPMHCNVWHVPPIPSQKRFHTCQKPVSLLERMIRVSSNDGATVLDCFMGSGSTGVACIATGRKFIGIEKDKQYFEIAQRRIAAAGAAAG